MNNSSYFGTYYLYRKHVYDFRGLFLPYLLNYAVTVIKAIFNTYNRQATNRRALWSTLHPAVKLMEAIVMFPYTLKIHES